MLFPRVYRERGHVLFDQGPFIFRGKVEEEFGAVTVTVTHLDRLERMLANVARRPNARSPICANADLPLPERSREGGPALYREPMHAGFRRPGADPGADGRGERQRHVRQVRPWEPERAVPRPAAHGHAVQLELELEPGGGDVVVVRVPDVERHQHGRCARVANHPDARDLTPGRRRPRGPGACTPPPRRRHSLREAGAVILRSLG